MRQPIVSRPRTFAILAGSIALVASHSAQAIDYTWDGGSLVNDLWGTGENWSPDGAPSPGSTNSLIFAGTTRLTPQNNYGDGDDFQNITFDATAGAFTISNTGTNGIDWFGSITNNSANTQTIGFRLYQSASNTINATSGNLTLNSSALLFRNGQALTLTAATAKTIQIDSVIANGGGGAGSAILIDGAGTVRLNGANTFTSGVNVTNGTLSISADNNLGATAAAVSLNGGTLSVTGSGTMINTHAITVGASGGTINNLRTSTFRLDTANTLLGSGTLTVTGNGSLVSTGAGVVVLNNSNTYSGNIIAQDGGILEYANASGLVVAATITIGNNGSLSSLVNVANNVTVTGGTNSILGFQNNNAGNYGGTITLNANAIIGLRDWYNTTNASNVRSGTISGVISGTGFGITTNSGTSGATGTLTLTNANTYTGATTIAANTVVQLGSGGTTGAISTSSAISNSGTLAFNRSNAVAQGTDFSGAALTGSGGIAQNGSGTTTLNVANTFTGSTTLTAGTLSVADTTYLGGATANNNIVFNGGTLQVTGTTMTSFGSHTVTYNASKTVGFDINHAANNFNAGSTAFVSSDTLLKIGAGTLTLGAASNTLKTVQLNQGTLDIGLNNLTISNVGGATINSTLTSGTVTINATGGGKIVLTQNNATDGPDIGIANGGTLVINAAITGTSAYENWTGTANGTGVTVLTGANDYTGNTIINGGVLSVANIGNTGSTTSNLGQSSTINMSAPASGSQNSTLRYTGTGETTDRAINFHLNGTNTGGIIEQSGTGLLKFSSNQTSTGTGTKTLTLQGSTAGTGEFAGNIVNGSSTISVTKAGTGTWTLSGANTYTGGTRVNAGTLVLSGSHTKAGGTTDFLSINNVGAQNAVLKIVSGANLGHRDMPIAETTNTRGAVYQSGGALSLDNGFRVGGGQTSYGYYSFSDGTLTNTGNDMNVGAGNSATGVMDVSGGSISTSSWIVIGRGDGGGSTSSGLLNVTGGSIGSNSNNIALNWAKGSGAISILNVGGGAGAASVTGVSNAANYLDVSQASTAGATGVVNLRSNGTLTVAQVRVSGAASTALLNFDGGTLKATAANAGVNFMNSGNMDAVTVYSGGGTIHNNGTNITVGNVLGAATGNGVTSIAVTNGGSGYIGAPLVTITGGTGNTATGYAVMVDDGTGNGTFRVGSIVVTSPGTYSVDPTSVALTGGGETTPAEIGAITTAANASGGMTYSGSGTTTLSGANTYTGGTTVSAGTVKAGVASVANVSGAVGNNSAVTMANVAGATLDITGFNTQIGSLTGGGATGGNVTLGAATLTTGGDNTSPAAYAGVISGTGGLTKIGSGTQTLSGANTYTGATTVSDGTLKVDNNGTSTLGKITGSAAADSIKVNAAGTLLLSGAGATDRVNDAAGITLAGGMLSVASGSSEGAAATVINGTASGTNTLGIGTLTLSATSTLDFDSLGASTLLAFTGFAPGAFTLNITNWSNPTFDGTLNSGLATDDRFVVSQDLAAANLLSSINFGAGLTTTQLALGGGFYEIGGLAAIPEPGTIFAAAGLLGLVVLCGRRRSRRDAAIRNSARRGGFTGCEGDVLVDWESCAVVDVRTI